MNISIRNRLLGVLGLSIIAIGTIGTAAGIGFHKVHVSTAGLLSTNAALKRHQETDMMHDAIRCDVFASRLGTTKEELTRAQEELADHIKTIEANLEANATVDIPGLAQQMSEVGPKLDAYVKSAQSQVGASWPARNLPRPIVRVSR